MKWWNQLSVRLSVFVLLLAIVPLAGFGLTAIRDIRRVRLSSVEQIHKAIANQSVKQIESSLADTVKEIQLVIETNDLENMDANDQEWILQLAIKALPQLNTLTLVANDGLERIKVGRETVFNQNNLEKRNSLPAFQKKGDIQPVLGALHRNSDDLLTLDIYIPLLDPVDRHVAAIIDAEVDIEMLLGFTADLKFGKTGYVYVVDAEGKFLLYPDHSAVLAGEDALQNPLVKDFVSGLTTVDTNGTYYNRYHIKVISNAQAVAEPKMLVVVSQSLEDAMATVTRIGNLQTIVLCLAVVLAVVLVLYFSAKTFKPLKKLESGVKLIGAGDYSERIPVTSSDELGSVTQSFNTMADDLEKASTYAKQNAWLREGIAKLDALLRGDQSLENICTKVVTFMAEYLQQQVGTIYTSDRKGWFNYMAGYAFQSGPGFSDAFKLGETLPGQAAAEQKIIKLRDLPAEYIAITSSLGSRVPKHLYIVPFVHNNWVEAVMELGSLQEPTELEKQFLSDTADSIAIIISSARARQDLAEALRQTKEQAEELQRQQEELQASNEEMEEQTQLLTASESKLREQQEELQAANEELEEKTQYLERNKKNIEEKNLALEELRGELEKKAEDLAIASKYKSEFLANMSHELRTPLNSLLLLSRLLAENRDGNLLEEQVDSAQVIYNSGNDLLSLINDILDLSKIEAGKMELRKEELSLSELLDGLARNFRRQAEEKGLSLQTAISDDVPATIINDQQRIEQVLKNFISNAFKFTEKGGVTIEICRPKEGAAFVREGLSSQNTIAITVRDTGIGIPAGKQKIIFEAFQQLEGGTARKYGGTGLGLSISRELAKLLGGEIQLESEEHTGSTFTLILQVDTNKKAVSDTGLASTSELKKQEEQLQTVAGNVTPKQSTEKVVANNLADDREYFAAGDKTILIIEDDESFAKILLLFCREKGFKGLVALTGEEGLKLAEQYLPKAIILDIHLPGMDGWAVLETLKENPSTRHIPVHFMSSDDPVPEAFTKGAVGYLTKPVNQEELEQVLDHLESMIDKAIKDLLLVEDNENQRRAISKLILDSDVAIHEVCNAKQAIAALRHKQFDCMIMDLGLPDMSGFDLLKEMEKDPRITPPPVVVYTGRELTVEEENELRKYSESIIIKGVRSEERLLDETSLFLHRMVEKMPDEQRKMISALHDTDTMLRDRNILIVDDDMRNVFALSKVLNDRGIKTTKAENGLKALEILEQKGGDLDLVLMDIMMPQMDGYETMQRIRAQSRFSNLPIIALTAKAMQRDKDECIAAGANDYLAKPVDIERLFSMMRVWLYR